MGNVVCWSGVTPKSKWREPECHHVCREFLLLMVLFSPLSCAPSLDLEKTELTLYLPVWSTGRGKFTV